MNPFEMRLMERGKDSLQIGAVIEISPGHRGAVGNRAFIDHPKKEKCQRNEDLNGIVGNEFSECGEPPGVQ